jgi:poly-gamma-glutamate synthase PgsB/CapB
VAAAGLTALEPIDWGQDLASRGAIAASASVFYVAAMIAAWWWWNRRLRHRRDRVPVRVLVTGSRGKSSTVRALHAALRTAGYRPYAKTTGTAAVEIQPDGTEQPTRRFGRPSVLEVLRRMDAALGAPVPPDALIFECMAVQPGLIRMVADEMVDPNVVVITNVQIDHLEDEGSDTTEIAASLAHGITKHSLVVTGETAPGPRGAIEHAAVGASADLQVVNPDEVADGLSFRMPYVHPQNATINLSITRALGIDDDDAVHGMAEASHEPGEQEVWRRQLGDLQATYVDLGAINDPDSLLAALRVFPWPPEDVVRIGLVVGRWDRPLRSLTFLGCLRPRFFDGLVLGGGPDRRVRRDLIEHGWEHRRIATAAHLAGSQAVWNRRILRLTRRIRPDARRVLVVSLENEHDGIADRGREFFHGGERVHLPAGWSS